ncbi:hypothetical protein IFM89_028293 [Coptis chinensis]|uniref:Uncharacterized protein n=1 Tax=Coptis chinensis TaxID=261450 RepID=A0A835HHU8_9MAGN|nr:hypothetical protein IFM89_028293 [Coptis chinensis]
MKQGIQWFALMQALAMRPNGPPSFRLTSIGPPQPDNIDALQQLILTHPFWIFGPAKTVVVNSMFELHQLLAQPNAIDNVLDVKVLVKCDKVKQFALATTEDDGSFEAELTADPSSTNCQAQLLGGPNQLCGYKKYLVSKIVKAQDSKSYTTSTPLAYGTSCSSRTKFPSSPSNAKSGTAKPIYGSSKTVDLPLPREWGMPPTSYYFPILPIAIP